MFFLPRYRWGDIQVPWDPLDEDGNEDKFEDTVSLSHAWDACIGWPYCDMIHRFSIEHWLWWRDLDSVLCRQWCSHPRCSLFGLINIFIDFLIPFQLLSRLSIPLLHHPWWACTFTAFPPPACIVHIKPIHTTLVLVNAMSYLYCQQFYNQRFAQISPTFWKTYRPFAFISLHTVP